MYCKVKATQTSKTFHKNPGLSWIRNIDLNQKLEQIKQNKSINKLTVNSERDDTRDDLPDLLDTIGSQTLVISSIISGDSLQPESGSFTKTLSSLLEYQQVK